MPHLATIESLPEAFAMVKAMCADGLEWGEGYRPLGRLALAAIIEGRMGESVSSYLDGLAVKDEPDRRNGHYRRHLLTELGDIELWVPRTRRFSPTAVLKAYVRRSAEIDRAILAGFVLGLSTRKVGEVLLALLGRSVSAATVSEVAKTLDQAVAAFHRRPLNDAYKVLMLDGVVLARKTGAGALRRPVLVALGLRPDGKKEIIDFKLAASESAAEWEAFLTDLYRRGLAGAGLDMICVDGGAGLLAALPVVFPGLPVQRCWAHKIRNVLLDYSSSDPGLTASYTIGGSIRDESMSIKVTSRGCGCRRDCHCDVVAIVKQRAVPRGQMLRHCQSRSERLCACRRTSLLLWRSLGRLRWRRLEVCSDCQRL